MPSELIEVVKAGDVAAAQRLFAEGADVNARDETGATLLPADDQSLGRGWRRRECQR